MARRGTARLGPFGRWWESQSDRHYQIITYSTIISVSSLVWGFVFLFVLDGHSDPEVGHLVPWSWLAFIGGLVVAFYAAPEFGEYWKQQHILEDILLIESRPEILRRRKEAEDAADMLGKSYQARLMGLYKMHNVNIGKKYRVEPVSPSSLYDPTRHTEVEEVEIQSNSGKSWWYTSDSTLLLTSNTLLGLFTSASGARDHTLDLTASIYEQTRVYETSPHYDVISLLFIALFAGLLLSTRPRTRPSDEEE